MTIAANIIRSVLIRGQYQQIESIQTLSLSENDAVSIVSLSAWSIIGLTMFDSVNTNDFIETGHYLKANVSIFFRHFAQYLQV